MTGPGHDHRRSAIPFWAHQLVELLLALVLLVEGARRGAGIEVLGAAVVLLVFALTTDGPLGAWRGISRSVHRIGDFVLAALLAAAPLALGVSDVFTITLLLVAAASLCWLGLRGDFTTREWRAPWRRGAEEPASGSRPAAAVPAPAASTPGGSSAPSATSTARSTSRDIGRVLGRLRAAGPRAAGRTVGRAVAKSPSPEDTSPPAPPAEGEDEDARPD